MGKSLTTLMEDALRIKNETGEAQNTATRVGSLFEAIVEALGEIASAGLLDGSVTTAKIADKAVTLAKLSEELRSMITGGGGNPIDAYTKAESDAIKDGLRDDINQYSRFFDSEMGDVWRDDARQDAEMATLRGSVNAIQAATLNTANQVAEFQRSETAARTAAEATMRQGVAQIAGRLTDYYTKSEVNSIVSNTPETDVIVAESLTAVADSEDDAYVAPADRANKLFRIPDAGGTSFSEYAWNGSDWVQLDKKDYGVDQEPTEGSNNLMDSGGLYDHLSKFIGELTNSGFKFALTDPSGGLVAGLDAHDVLRVFLEVAFQDADIRNLIVENITNVNSINGITAARVSETPYFKFVLCDPEDNIVFAITEQGDFVNGTIKYTPPEEIKVERSAVYVRNRDKEPYLLADSNYDYNPSYYTRNFPHYNDPTQEDYARHHSIVDWMTKRLQLLVVTDTHEENISFRNAVDASNDFITIDAVLHLGDFGYWLDPESDNHVNTESIIEMFEKPLYITPGNHDVGERSSYVKYCKDDIQLYNRYILPMVEKGYLANGEYLPGRCYYYHDFDQYKVRLIMLYPYDDGNVFEEDYWEHVTYNPSYADIAVKTYNAGEYVNVPGYDSFSFKAKQLFSVDMISTSMGTWNNAYARVPRFKTLRSLTWYQQAQLDWFCQALEGAGEKGYTVVVGQHEIPFDASNYDSVTESCFNNPRRKPSGNFNRYLDEDKEIIAQIVNAYQTKGKITKTIIPQESMISYKGPDDVSSMTPVVLNHTFARTGKVVFLHGHYHSDNIGRHKVYDELSIGFAPGTLFDCAGIDLYRRHNDERSMDTMTAVTIHEDKVHLTRIGCDVTGTVDPLTHTLKQRVNEAIGISKDYEFAI